MIAVISLSLTADSILILCRFVKLTSLFYRWTLRSRGRGARGCCVPTPTQCAIPPGSVNE